MFIYCLGNACKDSSSCVSHESHPKSACEYHLGKSMKKIPSQLVKAIHPSGYLSGTNPVTGAWENFIDWSLTAP